MFGEAFRGIRGRGASERCAAGGAPGLLCEKCPLHHIQLLRVSGCIVMRSFWTSGEGWLRTQQP